MARTRKWISALMAGFLAMCMLLASCAQPAGGGTGGGGGSGYTPPAPATPESKVVGTYTNGSLWYIFKNGGKGSVSNTSPSASIRALTAGQTFTWEVTGTSGDIITVAITVDGGGGTVNASFNTANGKASIDGVECTKQGSSSGGGTSTDGTDDEIPGHEHNYVFVDFTWTGFNAVANYRCSIDASHTKTENADITSEITKMPTASEEGARTYTATYDGHTDTKTETIPVLGSETFLGFTWTGFTSAVANYDTGSRPATVTSRVTKQPTCTATGTKEHTAVSGVNEEKKEETLSPSPSGHDYRFSRFAWNPYGYTASAMYTCSHDASHETSYAATITSEVTKAPTSTESGIKTYTATYDGHTDTKTQVLPPGEIPSDDGLVYTLSSDGTYYILSNGKISTDAVISIPAKYNGKPVKEIGENAFNGSPTLTSITIPDSVTSIGKWAFWDCRGLASITIGSVASGLTSIEQQSFTGCGSLDKIYFNGDINKWVEIEGLEYLMNPTVYGKMVTLYINGNTPTSIGITTASKINDYAFIACKKLQSVTIGNSVTRIGTEAFRLCSALTSVTIGNKVEEIASRAFRDCKITSITIPDSATTVLMNAFENCPIESATVPTSAIAAIKNAKLKTVKITSGESIEEFAFSNCTALTSVTIPTSVKSIEVQAFQNCTALTSVTIPTSVTSIGAGAFRDCTALTSIVIPDSVTSIKEYTFAGCSALGSVTLGNKVEKIGFLAFDNCSSLTSIQIPASVKSIEGQAFQNCTALTSIDIPDSVESIGDLAFAYCSKLTRVTMGDGVTYIPSAAFADSPIENLTLPASANIKKIDTLKTVKIIGTGSIRSEAFKDLTNLTNVTIGTGVTSIGDRAFENCSKLASITYAGTSAQWNSITKGSNWYKGTLIDRIHTSSDGYDIPPD